MDACSTPAETFPYEPSSRDTYSPISDSDPAEQLEGISTARHQVERDESLDCTLTQRHFCPVECMPKLSLDSMLKTLIQEYPDEDGDTVLHMAVVHNKFPLAELWKNAFPENFISELNEQNNLGQTPLHLAVFDNNLPMIHFFLQNGASVRVHEKEGRTPIHFACQYGNLDTLNLILQKIEQRNESLPVALNEEEYVRGLNSLLFFINENSPVTEDQFPVIDLLLRCGANPNHKDKGSGKNLAHYIADQNNVALYEYLQAKYPSQIVWNAARYDGGRVTLEDDIFIFEKDEN